MAERVRIRWRLGLADVRSLFALGSHRDFEFDGLTFAKGLETLALDRGEMDKYVLFPTLGGDEAVTFLITEPLDCASGHLSFLAIYFGFRIHFWLNKRKNRE